MLGFDDAPSPTNGGEARRVHEWHAANQCCRSNWEERVVIKRKIYFLFLPIAERTGFWNLSFCRNWYSVERASFCQKSLFLPKDCLSAEYKSIWTSLHSGKTMKECGIGLPKYVLSAERQCFCQKKLFLPIEDFSADISISYFCRTFQPKDHRNALSFDHYQSWGRGNFYIKSDRWRNGTSFDARFSVEWGKGESFIFGAYDVMSISWCWMNQRWT